jgi:hypothetical protein
LPAHKLSISKGQVASGKPSINRTAEPIAEWSKDVGLKKIAFDCDQNDIDADGGVWLLFDVAPAQQTGSAPVSWQIKELSVSLQGQIVAPAKVVSLEPPSRPVEVEQ